MTFLFRADPLMAVLHTQALSNTFEKREVAKGNVALSEEDYVRRRSRRLVLPLSGLGGVDVPDVHLV